MNKYAKFNMAFGDWCSALSIIIINIAIAFVLQFGGLSSIVSTFVADMICILICGFIYCKMQKRPEFQPCQKLGMKHIVIALIGFLLVTFYLISLSIWCTSVIKIDPGMANRVSMLSKVPFGIRVLFSCIIAPVYEELSMRLFSYNWMKKSTNWIISMLVTSFIFAALHGTKTHMITGTIFGIVMVLLYELTGTWWVPIIAHILYNGILMFSSSTAAFLPITPFIIVVGIILLIILIMSACIVDKLKRQKIDSK